MTADSEEKVFPVPTRLLKDEKLPQPYISSFEQYQAKWEHSINNTDEFFGDVKKKNQLFYKKINPFFCSLLVNF
jgi:hypothetical protein